MAEEVTPFESVPRNVDAALRRLRKRRLDEYAAMMRTGFVRHCPLCDYRGEFAPVGVPPRLDGLCPSCRSRERHRLFKLWLDREGRITKDHRVLHFAPEPAFVPILRGMSGSYVTADFMAPHVDLKLNIEALELDDASFDVVIAHQILEHVDHHKALAEVFRILTPGGVMLVTTPVIEAWAETYVNPAIQSRRERVLHFGQADHSRFFGRDLKDHMRAAGFDLFEYVSVEPDVSTYGLIRGETLFVLTKPLGADPSAETAVSKHAKTPRKG